ncbi:MAG: 2-dehydropantoate 2-reductase [Variovorax sp.]
MKVCIVGAGAIGGFIGARLAQAGHCQVSTVARGATLAALQRHGWRLEQGGELIQAPVIASDKAASLGAQDLVIVAVKGTAMTAIAPVVAELIGPETVVLPAMNGVPWWFSRGTVLGNAPLESVDPGGRISESIPYGHVLGCVVHASTSCPEPGLVRHAMGQGLIVGEPACAHSPRSEAVAALLRRAGFDVTESANVRYDIWYKLWGNLTMNPVSAITGATIDRLLADPLVREFCSAAMREAATLGASLGLGITQSPEDRHAVTAKLGAFKTSMLQDVEAGRPVELNTIVGAVHEIGRRLGQPTPNIDALLGLTRLFARTHQIYPS